MLKSSVNDLLSALCYALRRKVDIIALVMELFHGSQYIIEKPTLLAGKANNDYGRGFYCTQKYDMACEWACKNGKDGFVNVYALENAGLKTLDLLGGEYTILNWIALLLKNRFFNLSSEIALDAREYLISNFAPDLTSFDVVKGYRANDSYFSYAESFVENALPLKSLSKAMYLGGLGEQIALVSEKAFASLSFVRADIVQSSVYHKRFVERDSKARADYRNEIKVQKSYTDDVFVMDILRGRVRADDERIQRFVHR